MTRDFTGALRLELALEIEPFYKAQMMPFTVRIDVFEVWIVRTEFAQTLDLRGGKTLLLQRALGEIVRLRGLRRCACHSLYLLLDRAGEPANPAPVGAGQWTLGHSPGPVASNPITQVNAGVRVMDASSLARTGRLSELGQSLGCKDAGVVDFSITPA